MDTVLLVEDDEMESRLYQRLFTAEGFAITAINNGSDCRSTAHEIKPDIILLDIMMPKMNGFETLTVLRADEELKKIPVVILTNLSDSHYEEEALRRGAIRFVTKSQIENKRLVGLVRDIIDAYKKGQQPEK